MDNNRLETHFTYRLLSLPLKLNMAQVFDNLGLGVLEKYETKLIEKINEENLPIRLNLCKNNLAQNCIIKSIELHEEAYLKFDNKKKYKQHITYKILDVIDDTTHKINDVSSENIIITTKNMYATKAEFSEYCLNPPKLYIPSIDKTKPIINTNNKSSTVKAKPKKEQIQDKRFKLFEEFCEQVAIEKSLPDSKHQTVYNSYQPPMTKVDFYSEIEKKQGTTFSHNCSDFFRDTRLELEISKAARHRK
jgi:antitoxin component of RelBE/YafQ-DinJ toxin-antitoxin module